MKFNILKDSLSAIQKIQTIKKSDLKGDKKLPKVISDEIKEETKIPQYMTLSKLDWDNNEIHAGIIKDPTAKGGC